MNTESCVRCSNEVPLRDTYMSGDGVVCEPCHLAYDTVDSDLAGPGTGGWSSETDKSAWYVGVVILVAIKLLLFTMSEMN